MIVNRIFLSWRRGESTNRYLVGEVLRQNEGNFTFRYDLAEVEKAQKEGFHQYPEFPVTNDATLKYTGDLKSVFSLRLMPEGRSDRDNFLSFWEANNPNYDWFDELALTQGRLATDNFEFLGDYNYNQNGFKFVTDVAALSHIDVSHIGVRQGDILSFEREPNNLEDRMAVKLLKNNTHIGYVKRGHNQYFENANTNRLHLSVKFVEESHRINAIYVLVSKH